MLEEIHRELEKHFEETVKVRRYLHQHPELSFEEEETPKLIARLLTEMGIEVKTKVGGRGVIGTIYGGNREKQLRYELTLMPCRFRI